MHPKTTKAEKKVLGPHPKVKKDRRIWVKTLLSLVQGDNKERRGRKFAGEESAAGSARDVALVVTKEKNKETT